MVSCRYFMSHQYPLSFRPSSSEIFGHVRVSGRVIGTTSDLDGSQSPQISARLVGGIGAMAKRFRRAARKAINARNDHGLLGLVIFDEKLVCENFKKLVNSKANCE